MELKSLAKIITGNPLLAVVNATLVAVFLGLILVESMAGQEATESTPTAEIPAIVLEDWVLPNSDDPLYAKPVFHSDRHPAKKPTAPVQAVAEIPFRLELTGVLSVSDQIGWAFFRQTGGEGSHQIALGEAIDGWTLESLGDNQAVLIKGKVRKHLSLNNPLAIGQTTTATENQDQSQKPRTRKRK